MNPRDGAAGCGNTPHQVVGSLARRCDHQSFAGGLCSSEPFARRSDSLSRAIGTDYLRRFTHLFPEVMSPFAAPADWSSKLGATSELSATSIGVNAMRRNHYPSSDPAFQAVSRTHAARIHRCRMVVIRPWPARTNSNRQRLGRAHVTRTVVRIPSSGCRRNASPTQKTDRC